MKQKITKMLRYPENFRVTIIVGHLDPECMLQDFIDHISFYSFIGGRTEPGYHRATAVLHDMILEYGLTPVQEKNEDLIGIRQMYLELIENVKSDDQLSEQKKMQYCAELLQEWDQVQRPLLDCPEEVLLEQNKKVKLTFDFKLLCSLYGFKAERALWYYMKRICLAVSQAASQSTYKSAKINMPYLVIGKADYPQKNIRQRYEHKFNEVHAAMNSVGNFKQRVKAYKDFYQEWYDELCRDLIYSQAGG